MFWQSLNKNTKTTYKISQHSLEILQLEVCILNKNLKQYIELFQAGKKSNAYQYRGP